jgi:NhaA family Na+:H+ antiporter
LPIKLIKDFIKLESSAGIILFAAALLAIFLDNSALSPYYQYFIEVPLSIQLGDWTLSKHLIHWVNDGLMAIFFLMVGLEIKREILEGELNSPSKVILPGIAALGGMIVPALIFSAFNLGNDYAMRGWAIPTATDIAFSLGILSLLGSRVPVSLKVFLATLAIFDDLGAIIIIALFYNAQISLFSLLLATICLVILFLLNRANVRSLVPYFFVGSVLWLCVLNSGVHATLAGVALAFALPMRIKGDKDNYSPANEVIKTLHPWVAFFVLPLFAFANAGVSLADLPTGISGLFSPVMLGIAAGLVIGKLCGVLGTTFLAVKIGFAKMPNLATWTQLLGIALICGVGFTMSFFVGTLAYPGGESTEPYDAWVRFGVIFGSLISGTLGYIVLRLSTVAKKEK